MSKLTMNAKIYNIYKETGEAEFSVECNSSDEINQVLQLEQYGTIEIISKHVGGYRIKYLKQQ